MSARVDMVFAVLGVLAAGVYAGLGTTEVLPFGIALALAIALFGLGLIAGIRSALISVADYARKERP